MPLFWRRLRNLGARLLEWRGKVETDPFAAFGMVEGERGTVQHQAVGKCWIAVELVADDRVTDAQRVCGVYAQLMGATGTRVEFDAGCVWIAFNYPPVGNTEFALFGVVDLLGTVGPVDAEGQFDMA